MRTVTEIARQTAGYRELFAMDNGNKRVYVDHRGHVIWRYTYSRYKDYQDANGAEFDATDNKWIG